MKTTTTARGVLDSNVWTFIAKKMAQSIGLRIALGATLGFRFAPECRKKLIGVAFSAGETLGGGGK
jgi:hypothetical protein